MSRRQTAIGRVFNVVVLVFPTDKMAETFIIQMETQDILNKLKLGTIREYRSRSILDIARQRELSGANR